VRRTWLPVRVDLVEGHGEDFWPRPGRMFAAARSHTLHELAVAIDDAFARWGRAHLHQFRTGDEERISTPDPEFDGPDEKVLDEHRTTLARLRPGERFVYEFDLGDRWTHLCTVGHERIDPVETVGLRPAHPMPYWGWGDIPDQYGRRWDGDDGEHRRPPDPKGADLPRLGP
jgi:hypothetical protein